MYDICRVWLFFFFFLSLKQRACLYLGFAGCKIGHSKAALANDLCRAGLGLIRHDSTRLELTQLIRAAWICLGWIRVMGQVLDVRGQGCTGVLFFRNLFGSSEYYASMDALKRQGIRDRGQRFEVRVYLIRKKKGVETKTVHSPGICWIQNLNQLGCAGQ